VLAFTTEFGKLFQHVQIKSTVLLLQEFMLCYAEEKDPRKCLNEGKEVTRCGIEFFQNVREQCAEEFTKYWQCLDYGASYDMHLKL